jgi:hypothetical protein
MFELGTASAIASLTFRDKYLTMRDINQMKRDGYEAMFMKSLHKIDSLKMYDELGNSRGWTRSLASKARKTLLPEIIKAVTLAWYSAILMSESKK